MPPHRCPSGAAGPAGQAAGRSAALQDLQRRWLTAEEDAAREAVEREALAGLADILALRAEAIVAEPRHSSPWHRPHQSFPPFPVVSCLFFLILLIFFLILLFFLIILI